MTGEGGDVTVLDDPHKPEEAQSDLTRQFVLDWHDATWSTRLNDPETGVKIVVMQRLHERDLTGHLLERGGWEHLCLPAGYAPSHQFAWPRDPRTEPGEVLWEKWGRRGSPRRSSSSAPTAMPVNTSSARRRPRAGSSSGAGGATTTTRASCPTSISSASRGTWRSRTPTVPDYVVGQVWGSFGAELYLLHQLRRRLEFTDTLHAVRELTRWVTERFPHREAHAKYVEDKANGPAVIATLRREVAGLIAVDPRGDKVARARAVAPALEAGNVYLPGRPKRRGLRLRPRPHPRLGPGLHRGVRRLSKPRPRRPGRRLLPGPDEAPPGRRRAAAAVPRAPAGRRPADQAALARAPMSELLYRAR